MDEPLKPLQVFIVEDSPIIRELLDRAVVAAGAEVVGHSESANEAIEALARTQADLIILDIRLRAGTRFDVLKALQATGHAHSAIKIVFTNYAAPEYRDRGLQLGANAFLDKASEGVPALNVIHRLAAQRRAPGGRSCGPEGLLSEQARG